MLPRFQDLRGSRENTHRNYYTLYTEIIPPKNLWEDKGENKKSGVKPLDCPATKSGINTKKPPGNQWLFIQERTRLIARLKKSL